MALFKQFRGNRASLDAQPLTDGYAYFCVDDGTFHIDYADADGILHRKQINAKDCETIMGISLEELKAEISAQDAVILHEAQTYTDAAKAEIQTYIDEQLGDMDATLDSIIAIQDSLIGGTITFTLEYQGAGYQGLELTADRGMTWRDWVYSEYNPDWLLYDDGGDLLGSYGDETVYNSSDEAQAMSDIIMDGEFYYMA